GRARRTALGAGVAVLTLLASSCGGPASGGDAFAGEVLDNPFQVDPTPLTATDGSDFSLVEDTDARLTLVFFGYTQCPDICGVVMAQLASAVDQLDAEDREAVQMVYVTTDPARDTEGVLRSYLDRLDPSFEGLTGDLGTIEQVASSVAVGFTEEDRLPSGGYEVTHSTQVLGIDGADEVPVLWTQETTATEYAADIHTLLTS
ncbi:MAG: SCO family protein, partial [Nocardioidaceae bacterium]|nr:SCO family protein [Nocardioidaceae bacterium]